MTKCTRCSHERANHYWNGKIGARCSYTEPSNGLLSVCKCSGYDPVIHEIKDESRRCIADYIKSYINFGVDGLVEKFQFVDGADKLLKNNIDSLYEGVRGDLYLNGKNPRVIAAHILYISTKVSGIAGMKRNSVTMGDVADILNISRVTMSRYIELERHLSPIIRQLISPGGSSKM